MGNGASVVIKGEVTASEDLFICGRVEGRIALTGAVLTLADGGTVVGDIAADSVVVFGNIQGNVVAGERLAVRTTAVIEGNLTTPILSVTEGAQITGKVQMPKRGEAKQPREEPEPVVKFPVAV